MHIFYDSLRGTEGYAAYGQYNDPSRYWGERLGIPELFETYEKVLGVRHAELQVLISRKFRNDENVNRLYNELIEEYVQLSNIPLISEIDKYHVVFGCISKFNHHDINYFVTVPYNERRHDLIFREGQIKRNTGNFHFEWILSDYTIELMERKLLMTEKAA
jgi:hypothetical protein